MEIEKRPEFYELCKYLSDSYPAVEFNVRAYSPGFGTIDCLDIICDEETEKSIREDAGFLKTFDIFAAEFQAEDVQLQGMHYLVNILQPGETPTVATGNF